MVEDVIQDVEDMKTPAFRRRRAPFGLCSVVGADALPVCTKGACKGNQVLAKGSDASRRWNQIAECPMFESLRSAETRAWRIF